MTAPHVPHPAADPAPPTRPAGGPNGFGIAAIIVGVVALAIAFIPFLGIIGALVGLTGLALGIVGLALQKYRGRRVAAIIGTIIAGVATVAAFILPWLTGLIWIFGWAQEHEVFDRLSSFSPEPWTPRESIAPTATESPAPAPTTVDPGDPGTGAPTTTPPVPTTTVGG